MWSDHISTDPCRWDGIQCNAAGSITTIGYDGFFDPIHGTLAQFNFSLFPNLEELTLDKNNLNGEIPEEIGNLHNVFLISLQFNSFTGQFPRRILNLTNIEFLDLNNNEFIGVIPGEISKLSKLIELNLDYNNFTGGIPAALGNMSHHLSNLRYISTVGNYLTGTIPKFTGPGLLGNLDFSGNMLSGQIPTEIGNMTELEYLDFSYNELQGGVPATITQLPKLQTLQLQHNQLTGSITPYLGKKIHV
jgi:Leucine rich repeat/Leucine Rich Repeat